MSARVISRGTALYGKYGNGDAEMIGHAPSRSGPVEPPPLTLGRSLAPGMAELQADFGGRLRVHEIDEALPRRLVRVVVHAGATQRDTRLLRHVGHLGEHQARTADRARTVVHEVP